MKVKAKEKCKKLWKWLRETALNKEMIVYTLIAEAIFWSPCIVTGLLAVTINEWWWTVFSAICAFWAAPITPAIALQIGLAVAIKKIVERKRKMSVNLKSRSTVTLKDFKGLDTLSTSVNVSAIHATEMQNLISRDGVNHKRYGWKTMAVIKDIEGEKTIYPKIQGVFDFTVYEKKFTFAYANKKFWQIKDDGKCIEIYKDIRLTDTKCLSFINGNKVYFVGCGDYLVFSKWEDEKFEIRRVIESNDVYIPTTTENIGYENMPNPPTRITAEERNILSEYNYNTLIGPDSLEAKDTVKYYLDTKNFTDIEVTIKNKAGDTYVLSGSKGNTVYSEGNEVGRCIVKNYEYSVETMDYTPDVLPEIQLFSLKDSDGEAYKVLLQLKPISYVQENIILYEKQTTFVKDAIPHLVVRLDDSDIEDIAFNTIRLDHTVFYDSRQIHYQAKIGDLVFNLGGLGLYFGENATGITIYKPGNTLRNNENDDIWGYYDAELGFIELQGKNLDDTTEWDDIYAPFVPSEANIIVKLKKSKSESFRDLGIACKFGTQGVTDRLFIVDEKGNTVRWSKDEDFTYFGEKSWCVCGTTETKITGMDRLNDSTLMLTKEFSITEPSIYTISGNMVSYKTEAETTDYVALFSPKGYQVGRGAVGELINFNGDCIMVAKDGFYTISLGENMTVDSRYITQRSKQISNILEKIDLKNAKCVVYDGKFYASVDGECFVADSKYITQYDGVNQYEWWRWTNIPVSVWGFVNNELWFGTEDGQICCFSNKFYDEGFINLGKEGIGYEVNNNNYLDFYFLNNSVTDNDIIVFTCDMWGKVEFSEYKNNCIYGIPLGDYDVVENIYIHTDTENLVENFLKKEEDFLYSLQPIYNNYFYRNYKGKKLKISELKDIEWLIEKTTPSNDITARLYTKTPIVAVWQSGAIDLGTRVYSKTLTGFSLTGERDLANLLKYGIITRLKRSDYEHFRANNDLEFSGVDLQTISLDTNFASSYFKKLNIRDVNFIQLYFLSDTSEDMAINSVQLEFKIYKKNLGVR